METQGLVGCRTCRTRTLPRIAAGWPEGRCDLCRDPALREAVRETVGRARTHFAELDRNRERDATRVGEDGYGAAA